MIYKILTPLAFFVAQFLIAWYGNYTGKLPAQGTFLGIVYDSIFLRALFTQLQFIWLLIIINVLFSLGFHWGFLSFKHFLVIATIWISMGVIAKISFNALFAKQPLDIPLVAGLFLVLLGAILVTAHEDIAKLLK